MRHGSCPSHLPLPHPARSPLKRPARAVEDHRPLPRPQRIALACRHHAHAQRRRLRSLQKRNEELELRVAERTEELREALERELAREQERALGSGDTEPYSALPIEERDR